MSKCPPGGQHAATGARPVLGDGGPTAAQAHRQAVPGPGAGDAVRQDGRGLLVQWLGEPDLRAVPPLREQPERGLAVGVPRGHAGVRGRARHARQRAALQAPGQRVGVPGTATSSRSTARPASGCSSALGVVTRPAAGTGLPGAGHPVEQGAGELGRAADAIIVRWSAAACLPWPEHRAPGPSSLLTPLLRGAPAALATVAGRHGQHAGGDRGERRCSSCHAFLRWVGPLHLCAIHQGRSIHPIGWHNARARAGAAGRRAVAAKLPTSTMAGHRSRQA